jgi:hypothetical protein
MALPLRMTSGNQPGSAHPAELCPTEPVLPVPFHRRFNPRMPHTIR